MSQIGNDNPSLCAGDDDQGDARQLFEEQAIAAFYASGTDLAACGYSLYDMATLLIRVFEKPSPVDPPPPESDPFAG